MKNGTGKKDCNVATGLLDRVKLARCLKTGEPIAGAPKAGLASSKDRR